MSISHMERYAIVALSILALTACSDSRPDMAPEDLALQIGLWGSTNFKECTSSIEVMALMGGAEIALERLQPPLNTIEETKRCMMEKADQGVDDLRYYLSQLTARPANVLPVSDITWAIQRLQDSKSSIDLLVRFPRIDRHLTIQHYLACANSPQMRLC